MSSTTESTAVTVDERPSLFSSLFPSVVSGIILGVIGAVIAGVLVNKITTAYSPDGVPNDDAVTASVFIGWVFFFMIGVGAFNGIIEWGFGRHELTHAEEMHMAGKGQGLWRYFRYTTDHKVVGLQYLATALALFFVGSLGAFSIRLEQSRPGAIFFNPSTYNTIVGMHGIIMIVATIIMITGPVGNFVVPIMIGARDMAFPRLNALSYWLLFVDVPVILSTLFLGGFQTGWTGYAPLAVQGLTPGMLSYNFFIVIFAISTTIAAMNIMTTVLVMRTRGMTWGRLPVTVWGVFFSVSLGLMAFPFFLIVQVMVVLDRVFQTSFFLAASGGSNWLYQHLFWFFGHPEVYVIVLPALAVAAEIAVVFTRKPVFGYRLIIASMLGISILSVIVWGHHLYTSGSQDPLNIPFMLDTELISIPTGIFFLALIGTIWRGKIWVTVPMLFVLACWSTSSSVELRASILLTCLPMSFYTVVCSSPRTFISRLSEPGSSDFLRASTTGSLKWLGNALTQCLANSISGCLKSALWEHSWRCLSQVCKVNRAGPRILRLRLSPLIRCQPLYHLDRSFSVCCHLQCDLHVSAW